MSGAWRALGMYRGEAVRLACVTMVVGLAAAMPALFSSSAGSAALAAEADRYGEGLAGFRLQVNTSSFDEDLDAVVRVAAADVGVLGEGLLTTQATLFRVTADGRAVDVNLIARDGALEFVGARAEKGGIWLPDTLADELGVQPGTEVGFDRGGGAEVRTAQVAGLYSDATRRPPSDFWRGISTTVYGDGVLEPLPMVLTDFQQLGELVSRENRVSSLLHRDTGLRVPSRPATLTWAFPLRVDGLTLTEAEAGADRVGRLIDRIYDPEDPVIGRLLNRVQSADAFGGSSLAAISLLEPIVGEAQSAVVALGPSAWTVAAAGVGVGLAMLAVVTASLGRERRVEGLVRIAQGQSRVRRARDGAAEALVPVVAGSGGGWLLAWWLVGTAGPGEQLDSEAVVVAAWAAALAGVIVLVLVAGVAGVAATARTGSTVSRSRRLWQLVAVTPWEVLPLLLAVAGLLQVMNRGAMPVERAGQGGAADVLIVAVPLLGIMGIAVLLARGLAVVLPRLRRYDRHRPLALWLASRRVAATRGGALALVAAVTTAVGIVAYAAAASASTMATVGAKMVTRTGAEVVLDVSGSNLPAAEDFAFPAALVMRTSGVLEPSDVEVDVLAVDPASLNAVTEVPDEALQALATPATQEPMVVLAGGGGAPTSLDLAGREVGIRVGAAVEAFPGMDAERPLVVVDRPALDAALAAQPPAAVLASEPLRWRTQLWARGDLAQVEVAATDAGLFVSRATEAQAVVTAVGARETTWALGLFAALGVVAGALAMVGLLAHVATRQREQALFSLLAARMRLPRSTQLLAVAVELVALLIVAAVVGAAAGVGLAWAVTQASDPLPALPPGPRFVVPFLLLVALPPTVVLAGITAALMSQRRAAATHAAILMRRAE